MMLLFNVSLKLGLLTMAYTLISLLKKNASSFCICKSYTHFFFFFSKNICELILYEGESISNQPNLFPVEIHLFFFDVITL